MGIALNQPTESAKCLIRVVAVEPNDLFNGKIKANQLLENSYVHIAGKM